MDFKFAQNQEKQKITSLEKELSSLQDSLKAENISFGTKLLTETEDSSSKQFIKDETLQQWTRFVQDRKEHTDTIIQIKSALERKDQLKKLAAEAKKTIAQKEGEIKKEKETFTLFAYQNHRNDFLTALQQVPELADLEAEIEAEKNKISDLSGESEKASFFTKLVPAFKSFVSKSKVTTTEIKVKKLLQDKFSEIFSDDDFTQMFEIIDELPSDLQEPIQNLKSAYETYTQVSAKLSELESQEAENNSNLATLNAQDNPKKQIDSLMQKITELDEQIETIENDVARSCVNTFFDQDGNSVSTTEIPHRLNQKIQEIAKIRSNIQQTKLKIEIEKTEIELKQVAEKQKSNLTKIEKLKKQVAELEKNIEEAVETDKDFSEKLQKIEETKRNLIEGLKN